MAEQSSPIDIRTPGLRAALVNVNHLCAFEILRRFGRPATIAEVALSAQRSQKEIQSAMDALEAVGLTSMLRAGRGRRLPTWTVTCQAIVATYEIGDPADEAALASMAPLFNEERRQEILRLTKPRADKTAKDFYWNSLHAGNFNSDEIRELYGLLQQLESFLYRCNQRHTITNPEEPQVCNYHVAVDVEPLLPGVLPLPTLQILGRHSGKEPPKSIATAAASDLSDREFEIAQLLVKGSTKREVADQCGISQHTVAELTRRVYRKLGINRRAQLAVALGQSGAA
jgi:DNA-binding CsgD family transcriptional regulator